MRSRLNSRSPKVLTAIGVGLTLVLALTVVIVLLLSGGSKALSDNAALIGALVALGGVFTTQMVNSALEDRRTQETRELEDQRTQEARELEAQRVHEAALRNYLEDVGELLIEKPLRDASPSDNLSTVVRAQTLSVLEGLDPDRQRILLQFMYESELVHGDEPVVNLAGANLSGANLINAELVHAKLSRTYLNDATLNGATLRSALFIYAHLVGAKLVGADLRSAKFIHADLSRADLRGADFSGADLRGTNLRGANLNGALGWTEDQVNAASSLEGATLPDGSKHP